MCCTGTSGRLAFTLACSAVTGSAAGGSAGEPAAPPNTGSVTGDSAGESAAAASSGPTRLKEELIQQEEEMCVC